MVQETNFDVIIVGAGISGIDCAYRLQERLPHLSYAVLDGRGELGGTWSLFKYPGIRSDSDLITFGFPWHPWESEREIATAPAILDYLQDACQKNGIDKRIRYHHHVSELHWKSDLQLWQVKVLLNHTPQTPSTNTRMFHARYIVMGTGYYDYHEPLATSVPGLEMFKGSLIHPQFWPTDLDHKNKRVAIIGSGATAVTILPAMAQTAEKVTMIQRSPGFFFTPPLSDGFNIWAKRWLPAGLAYRVMRARMIVILFLLINFCWWFPNTASRFLKGETKKLLPPDTHLKMDPDFTPAYTPMQQRLCISPGGDFFDAIKSDKGDIVTGQIERVEANGVRMTDGRFVEADILITATGLKIHIGGHSKLFVDGEEVPYSSRFVWKGTMLQDVPNFAFVVGYVDTPWTLGSDATARLFTRIIKEAERRKAAFVMPKLTEKEEREVKVVPYIGLNSTYLKRGKELGCFPKGGDRGPWVPRHSYMKDNWAANYGSMNGLVFRGRTTK
ncbi:Baeyer-Villiger monooxygenase [Cyphellophora attinorum]|uniref:Amine oxidase n=1 Tax=Cyphellophora attinorum TaxID=1664694 RepID=A0A0N1P1C3_9EURO|nr:Baeyer-Villiger monooxygenase [Phialophora attinorum]KPI44152.1 Baeyer-Villiger monooxygenase [Phialophora attinorum]